MRVFYSLYDRLLSSKALKMAFRKVKSAKGAAGIDGQSVHDFAEQEDENVAQLVIPPAMPTGQTVVVTKPSQKSPNSFANTSSCGGWIWT